MKRMAKLQFFLFFQDAKGFDSVAEVQDGGVCEEALFGPLLDLFVVFLGTHGAREIE